MLSLSTLLGGLLNSKLMLLAGFQKKIEAYVVKIGVVIAMNQNELKKYILYIPFHPIALSQVSSCTF